MHILHVLDHSIPLHSGYTFRTMAILKQQHAMGWKTYHLTSGKQGNDENLEEDVEDLHFFRSPRIQKKLFRLPVFNQIEILLSLSRRLEEIIPKVKPHILHAHSPALNGIATLRAARRAGIPLVYEVRAFWEDAAVDHGTSREGNLRYRSTRALETYVLRQADAVTTICEGLRSDIIARGIPASKVTVIPNAVDLERFPFSEEPDLKLKDQLGLTGCTVLGFIGSFYAYEGLSLLLKALPGLLKVSPEIRVLLVGGGPQEVQLRQESRDLGVADQVIFTGRIPNDQISRYYDLIDILVYPRLSMRLTELVTPLKPLEAMARGRLVLASDVGGHRELIRDCETGYLFPAGDAEALIRMLLYLLKQHADWPTQRQSARRFVETERSWLVSVSHYRQVYERVLNRDL